MEALPRGDPRKEGRKEGRKRRGRRRIDLESAEKEGGKRAHFAHITFHMIWDRGGHESSVLT